MWIKCYQCPQGVNLLTQDAIPTIYPSSYYTYSGLGLCVMSLKKPLESASLSIVSIISAHNTLKFFYLSNFLFSDSSLHQSVNAMIGVMSVLFTTVSSTPYIELGT